jgi:hypothetical protein
VSRNLFGSAVGHLTADGRDRRECAIEGAQAEMTVRISVIDAFFGSGTAKAADYANEVMSPAGRAPDRVAGLGDAAWIVGNPSGTTTLLDREVAYLVARRANAVVVISYHGESGPEVVRPAVIDTARHALSAVKVS